MYLNILPFSLTDFPFRVTFRDQKPLQMNKNLNKSSVKQCITWCIYWTVPLFMCFFPLLVWSTPPRWINLRRALKCIQIPREPVAPQKRTKRRKWAGVSQLQPSANYRKWVWLAVLASAAAMETPWQSRLTLQRWPFM